MKKKLAQKRKSPVKYRVELEASDWWEGCDAGNDNPVPALTAKEFKKYFVRNESCGVKLKLVKFERIVTECG